MILFLSIYHLFLSSFKIKFIFFRYSNACTANSVNIFFTDGGLDTVTSKNILISDEMSFSDGTFPANELAAKNTGF